MLAALEKVSFKGITTDLGFSTKTVLFAFFKLTFVDITIRKDFPALATGFVVNPIALVKTTIGIKDLSTALANF